MPESAASGVLVTRPAGQATPFGERLQAAGFSPLYLPTLAIAATDPTAAGAALRAALPCDFAVFISANAVQHALPAISATGGLPANCGVIAVGPASAQALRAAGFPNLLLPEARFDSEGVLGLPALQAVTGKRVLIFRGEGGRTLLAETLTTRGADVRALTCYRRVAAGDPVQLAAWLAQDAIAVVTATSRAGLQALMALAGPLAAQLKALPLAVLSPALAEYAVQAGFIGPVMAADQARDADLVTAVTRVHGTLAVDR